MKKEIIKNVFYIIIVLLIGITTLYIGNIVQNNAMEECLIIYENCSTIILK